jgi:hypothetical protein
MVDQAQGYRNILTSLLSTQNAEEAKRLTVLGRHPDNVYSFYRYCRTKIIDDEANRHSKYLYRVRDFQHVHFSPQDSEWDQLNELMEATLRVQHRTQISRKPFFKTRPDLDKALRKIKPLVEIFYEYTLSDDYFERHRDREIARREAAHCKPLNIGNIQMIISRARQWREFTHPWDLVACASILCGRRTQEIMWSMIIEQKKGYVIYVRGLLKQNIGEGPIPILTHCDEFDELLAKIREHRLPCESTTHRLKPAFMRMFGEWFNHTQRRNIYCEAAYRMRDESKFFPDYSRVRWFDKALCHDSNVIHQATSLVYQALTFNERAGEVSGADSLSS